jgi:hypothetical protein
MDAKTIKQLLKIAEANLKAARTEFTRINTTLQKCDDDVVECDWENLLEEAGNETYACEQVVRFLKEHLYGNKTAK